MRFIPIPWPKLGLQARLLTVIALVLVGIGITQPLWQTHQLVWQYRQDMAQQLATSLDGLQLAVQDQVIIGDFSAIEQTLRVAVNSKLVKHPRHTLGGVEYDTLGFQFAGEIF